jgi:hypothetical protein
MHHTVEAVEIRLREVAEVLTYLGNFRGSLTEIAARKKIRIKSDNFMTRGTQHGSGYRADITFVTGQKDSHTTPR